MPLGSPGGITGSGRRGMDLFLIDATGPFFRGYRRVRINWSKIPFEHLRTEEPGRRKQWDRIRQDMRTFAGRVAAIGYNAVTLDDVVHLVDHGLYTEKLRGKIAAYREEYRELFRILREAGLKIFLNQDVMSYSETSRLVVGTGPSAATGFLRETLERFLDEFPEVDGVVLRIGETDGLDVVGDFRSELVLRSARQVRRMLMRVLPVFEKRGKTLIFRTWTVGAFSVGDLIWHRRTLRRVLRGIESPALVLSMKYGESDFFRHLPLNRLFFETNLPKIVELQCRREYEGCGEYPSFVGGDYEEYALGLEEAKNMVGISVWCQTGGWLPFRRLAFLEEGAVWTELNAEVTIQIFRDRLLVEEAVRNAAKRRGCLDPEALQELLRLSEEVVKDLLYVSGFARQSLYLRRVRVPPLVGVYWNTVFVNSFMRRILRMVDLDRETMVREGRQAMGKLRRMEVLARRAGMPVDDIRFMRDTFAILSMAREYFFLPWSDELPERMRQLKRDYQDRYPLSQRDRYEIKLDLHPVGLSRRRVQWMLALALRKKPGYRLIDHILMLYLIGRLYRLVQSWRPHWIPEFARKSAMGMDAVFR